MRENNCLLDINAVNMNYEIPIFGSGWDARLLGEILSLMTLYDNARDVNSLDMLDLLNDCLGKAIIQDDIYQQMRHKI